MPLLSFLHNMNLPSMFRHLHSERQRGSIMCRQRRACPLCPKHLFNMSGHLIRVHGMNDRRERRSCLERCRLPKEMVGRRRKNCPLCSAKRLLRLSDHLRLVHKLPSAERTHWLDKAKVTCPKRYEPGDMYDNDIPHRRKSTFE